MKNILFPTDYSPASENAFIYALNIAKKLKAKITTVHVSNMPVVEIEGKAFPKGIERIQESLEMEEFEDYKDGLVHLKSIAKKNNLEAVPLQHVMENGKVIQTILKVANDEGVDLIIMGTKGAGWIKEVFFGSNTSEVLENATCPVLAIPQKAKFDGAIDEIAVTTNFTDEDKKVIHEALKFASWFDATVQVVHVDLNRVHQYTNKIIDLKKEFEAYINRMDFIVLDSDHFTESLAAHLENNSYDMVAMTTHKRNWIQELFNYSRAKSMTYQYNIPVLAMPVETL